MNFKPLQDRVILEPEVAEQKTKSGIVLPDSAQEKPQTGKVIKVGPGRISDDGKLIPMRLKEGDIVIYPKYSADSAEIKVSGTDYLIVKESAVLAVKG